MTVFEDWILKTVTALMRDAKDELGCDCMGGLQNAEGWDSLQHRLAIGLVQSRALECRHQATRVELNRPDSPRWSAETRIAVWQFVATVIQNLNARSRDYEAIALKMAAQWPPSEEEEPEPGPRLVQ